MKEPTTKAGQWLVDRTNWNDGMRGFFVRINATGSPQDMVIHVATIEREARAAVLRELRVEVEVALEDPRHGPPWLDDDHIVRSEVLDLIDRALDG